MVNLNILPRRGDRYPFAEETGTVTKVQTLISADHEPLTVVYGVGRPTADGEERLLVDVI